MAVLIQFESDKDCELAIDIMAEAEETYHGVPKDCFVVSNVAVTLFEKNDVRFRVLNRTGEEGGPHAPSS